MKLYYKTNGCDGLGFEKLWSLLFADKFSGFAKVDHDFIQVNAVTSWGWTMSDVHMHVFPQKEVLERQKKPGGIPLNIALIMFDSTSAANFKRKMPKSLEYLTDDLNSLLMRGEMIRSKKTPYWLKRSFSREYKIDLQLCYIYVKVLQLCAVKYQQHGLLPRNQNPSASPCRDWVIEKKKPKILKF